MCPTNNATHVCGKSISQLKAPGTRHTWGPDCIRAIGSHILTHRITPSCLWKRFASHLLPSLFLSQETYPDGDFWNKLVKKAENLLRNKIKSLVDQGAIIWDEHAEKWVFADSSAENNKMGPGRRRTSDLPSKPVTPGGSRWNEDVRNVAGGDGAIAINSNDARLTFHHTTNVYKGRKMGRRFKDAFASDTESDLSSAIPRRLVLGPSDAPSLFNPKSSPDLKPFLSEAEPSLLDPTPSPSGPVSASASGLASSASDTETYPSSSIPFEHPPLTPPSPSPSWPSHRHRNFTSSISPSESISVVGARRARSDIQPQLQGLQIKDLYSALDQLGTRLVELRVEMMREGGYTQDIQDARSGHLELLGNVCKELDRRVGVEGAFERRVWWLED